SILTQFSSTDHVYQTGNVADLDRDGLLGGRSIVEADFKPNDSTSGPPTFMPSAYNHPAIVATVSEALLAYYDVLAGARSSLHRDGVDQRLITQVTSLGSQGAIIADETVVGGPGTVAIGTPPLDTDQDGIPDGWELSHGLNPNNAADGNQIVVSTGYTNLEI